MRQMLPCEFGCRIAGFGRIIGLSNKNLLIKQLNNTAPKSASKERNNVMGDQLIIFDTTLRDGEQSGIPHCFAG